MLPFDTSAARRYAELVVMAKTSGRGFPTPDGYIAAIAASRGFIVASRGPLRSVRRRHHQSVECIVVLRWSANCTSRGQFKSLTFGELDKFRRFGLTTPFSHRFWESNQFFEVPLCKIYKRVNQKDSKRSRKTDRGVAANVLAERLQVTPISLNSPLQPGC